MRDLSIFSKNFVQTYFHLDNLWTNFFRSIFGCKALLFCARSICCIYRPCWAGDLGFYGAEGAIPAHRRGALHPF